jgi:tetratricopeptide (TPR) repeat protein/predicted O-methyltransferase YrrM
MGRKGRKKTMSHKERGDSLFDEGRMDEAIEEYKASVMLDPSDACSHFSLGDAYFNKGLSEEALGEIREAMRLKPHWPFYHKKLGEMMEALGRPVEAEKEYREALRLKPDLEEAREGLIRVSVSMSPGNLKELINYRKLYDIVRLSVELGVYSSLSHPASPEDLSDSMGIDADFIGYLLNALARFGYVEKFEKDGKPHYINTAASELYLNSKSASYVGDDIFGDLETYDALRRYVDEGPQEMAITKDYWSPALLKNIGSFALLGYVQEAVDKVDLSGRKTMLDIGGGHGLYSIFFTKKYPGLKAWVLDLPSVSGIARENVAKYGVADRVSVLAGDFQRLKPGRAYDVVFISNVTASYDELCSLVSGARGMLSPGGMLILRNYVSDAGAGGWSPGDWSPLVVLDRYSRRGRRGFSIRKLKSAMKKCRLAGIKTLLEADGVAIVCGVNE